MEPAAGGRLASARLLQIMWRRVKAPCGWRPQLVVFERGEALFVFNFHPTQSYSDYRVGCLKSGKYKIILSSDNSAFGALPPHPHPSRWPQDVLPPPRCAWRCCGAPSWWQVLPACAAQAWTWRDAGACAGAGSRRWLGQREGGSGVLCAGGARRTAALPHGLRAGTHGGDLRAGALPRGAC